MLTRALAVNPAAPESELLYLSSPKAPGEWSVTSPGRHPADAVAPLRAFGYSNTLAQPVWWWMLILGLIALVMETAWVMIKGEKI